MHTLLQYCTPRIYTGDIYPVLLLFYSKKKWKSRNPLRPARTVAGADIGGLSVINIVGREATLW